MDRRDRGGGAKGPGRPQGRGKGAWKTTGAGQKGLEDRGGGANGPISVLRHLCFLNVGQIVISFLPVLFSFIVLSSPTLQDTSLPSTPTHISFPEVPVPCPHSYCTGFHITRTGVISHESLRTATPPPRPGQLAEEKWPVPESCFLS